MIENILYLNSIISFQNEVVYNSAQLLLRHQLLSVNVQQQLNVLPLQIENVSFERLFLTILIQLYLNSILNLLIHLDSTNSFPDRKSVLLQFI